MNVDFRTSEPVKSLIEVDSERSDLRLVALEELHEDPANLRGPVDVDGEDIAELAGSVASVGVLSPLTVRPRSAGGYFLVAGHRRFAAAKRAGVGEVPVVVRRLDDWQVTEAMLAENGLRQNLHPRAEAEGYRKLLEAGKYTVVGLGSRLKIRPQRIWERLHFLQDGPELTEAVTSGRLPRSVAEVVRATARALHTVPGALLERMGEDIGGEWTARQVREWCRAEKLRVEAAEKKEAEAEAVEDAARMEQIRLAEARGEVAAERIGRLQAAVQGLADEAYKRLVFTLLDDALVCSSRLRLLSVITEGAAWWGADVVVGLDEASCARLRMARTVENEVLPPSGDLGVGAARCGAAPFHFSAERPPENGEGVAACGVSLESTPATPADE